MSFGKGSSSFRLFVGKVEQVEMSNVGSNGTESSIPNGNTGSKGKVKKVSSNMFKTEHFYPELFTTQLNVLTILKRLLENIVEKG